jgi:hypothetical protein
MKTSEELEQSKSKTNHLDYFGRVILFSISAASSLLKPKAIPHSFSRILVVRAQSHPP